MEPEKKAFSELSPSKRRLFKILLVIGGLFFGLLVTEISLRIVGYSFPEFYVVDEIRGYALSPNKAGWYQKEGKSFVQINADGQRDVVHLTEKPGNTYRIAILGDSYAEALQVPLEDAFWKVLERKLNDCRAFGGKQVEVLNFGVSGYGTAQEYLTLKEKVWKYQPDLVILAVTTNNDITDNSRFFKKIDIPYFVYENEQLKLDDSFKNSRSFRFRNSFLAHLGNWFYDNLRIVQAVHQIQVVLKYRWDEWKRKAAEEKAQTKSNARSFALQIAANLPRNDVGIENQIYSAPKDENWRAAWRATEGLIELMAEEVRNKGAQFIIVTLSNGGQVHPNLQARRDFMNWAGAEDLLYPDKRIKTFCESRGIPAVNLAPELQIYAEKNNVFLHGFDRNLGFGHWNSLGHRVAGEVLSEKMCKGIVK